MTTPVEQTRRAPRKRAADYTGKLTEKLQEDRKAEIVEASQRIAMVNAELKEEKNSVVDYTGEPEVREVEVREVEVATPYRMIRVNADINQMTFGRSVIDPGDYDNPDFSQRRPAVMGPMKYYDFEEGRLYRVTKDIAEHLQNIGYISYMGGA
jgi:hypothetical protein